MNALKIPTIRAEDWNELRDLARRCRPFKGINVLLHWTRDGVAVSLAPDHEWKHPWKLSPRWKFDPEEPLGGIWVASVNPGFVNGRDVSVQAIAEGETEETPIPLTAETPPEIAFRRFRNPAGSAGLAAGGDLEFRQQAAEGYPPFFETIGVVPPDKAGAVGSAEEDPTRTRQIRACDLVLITPRLATKQTVELRDVASTGQAFEISSVFVNDALRSAPSVHRLETVAQWSPPAEPTALDRLTGAAVEPQTDELLIATVYFVSPHDPEPDAEPDGTWECFPRYHVFWNLAHASKGQLPEAELAPLTLPTGLVGGLFDGTINSFLVPTNEAFSRIQAFLNGANFAGMYWAPSGIGWSKTTRPARKTDESKSKSGLDPRKRRIAKESEAVRKLSQVEPLNPPFPFLKTQFDPWFFHLEDEPLPPGSVRPRDV